MNGAVATALLTMVFVAAGTVLTIFEENVAGAVMLVVGVLGLFIVVGMTMSDARERK